MFTIGKPVKLIVLPDDARLQQENGDDAGHGMLLQKISLDCKSLVTSYEAIVPGTVTPDLSAVATQVAKAIGCNVNDLATNVQTITVEAAPKGTGHGGAILLTVNGIQVPL